VSLFGILRSQPQFVCSKAITHSGVDLFLSIQQKYRALWFRVWDHTQNNLSWSSLRGWIECIILIKRQPVNNTHKAQAQAKSQKQKAKATPTCIPATAQNNTPNTGHCRWWLAYHAKDAYWSRDNRNKVVIMACLHIHIYAQKLKLQKQSAMRMHNAQCAMWNQRSAMWMQILSKSTRSTQLPSHTGMLPIVGGLLDICPLSFLYQL
jgi:hypothetical protein